MDSVWMALKVYGIGAIISFFVAGLIKLLFIIIHRKGPKTDAGGDGI